MEIIAPQVRPATLLGGVHQLLGKHGLHLAHKTLTVPDQPGGEKGGICPWIVGLRRAALCGARYLSCDHLPLALGVWVLVSETQHHLVSGHGTTVVNIALELWEGRGGGKGEWRAGEREGEREREGVEGVVR